MTPRARCARLLAIALPLLLAGCVPVQGVGPAWLSCAVAAEEVVSDTMRANGLSLRAAAGHAITIPPGAAPLGTVFTLRALPTPMPQVVVQPSGALEGTATLAMSYRQCEQRVDPGEYRIWRQRAGGGWERVGGETDPRSETVRVSLQRFSTYALAAN